MLKFNAEQRVYQIGLIKVGGQPGQLPTLLIGNIFYEGMPEVTNHSRGVFNKDSVLKWMQIADELSEKMCVPHILDITAMYPEAMKRYITFVSERSKGVFSINGANQETRIAGLRFVKEIGLQDKVVFNGISPQTDEKELEAIKESGVKAAILLASNEYDFSPEGRISVLRGFDGQLGLLKLAEKAGIEKILIDTIVLDMPSIAYAAEAIKLVKDRLGYPAGCSPANATYSWRRSQLDFLKQKFAIYNAVAHGLVQLSGADFILYGPIKQVKNLIPACAMNDAITAYYAMRRLGIKPLTEKHPIYTMFNL